MMNKICQSIKRVGYLVELQASQKFKFATSKLSIILNLFIKIVLSVAIVYIVSALLGYLRFKTTGKFSLDDNMLAFVIACYFVISLISSIFSVISQIYKSTDNEFLFALPTNHYEIFISKIVLVLLQEIMNSIFILIPILLIFGKSATIVYLFDTYSVGMTYYFASVIMSVIFPFLTVGIALFLTLPIIVLSNIIKGNLCLKLSFVALCFSLYILFANSILNMLITTINYSSQIEVVIMKIKYFMLQFAEKSKIFLILARMLTQRPVDLLFLFLICLAMFAVAIFMIKKIYFNLVFSQNTINTSQKKTKIKKTKPFISMLFKDLNMLFSNGGDFVKYFVITFIIPCVSLLINKIFGSSELSMKGMYLILATNIAIISMFLNMNSSYVATALSQEGANFYLTKTAPVEYKQQILIKFLINYLINVVIVLACSMIMSIVTKLTFKDGLVMFFSLSIMNFAHLCHILEEELKSPMLDWFDVNELQNHKVLGKSNLYGLIFGLVFGGFAFKFYLIAPSRAWFEIIILACIVAVYRLYNLLKHHKYYLSKI